MGREFQEYLALAFIENFWDMEEVLTKYCSEINSKYNVMAMFPGAREQIKGNVTTFGTYILEFGILFNVLNCRLQKSLAISAFCLSCTTISFTFMLASFSILFPGIWFLIYVNG